MNFKQSTETMYFGSYLALRQPYTATKIWYKSFSIDKNPSISSTHMLLAKWQRYKPLRLLSALGKDASLSSLIQEALNTSLHQ